MNKATQNEVMQLIRWRKLEGSDPSAYEMIQKVQTLQKRLIAKTEEVVEADLLIQEKEKLYVELKNILARQPGPEVAEQLSIYQVCIFMCPPTTLSEFSKSMQDWMGPLSEAQPYKYIMFDTFAEMYITTARLLLLLLLLQRHCTAELK